MEKVKIGQLYYELDDKAKTATVTYYIPMNYKNKDYVKENVNIPSSVTCFGNTYNVTSIGWYAFNFCEGLTSITIPESVTSIGLYAFNFCTGLTSIKVNSQNKKYDSRNNCNAIIETSTNRLLVGCKNTIIPSSVTSIGWRAFLCCHLTSIAIPSSVTSIGYQAFYGCGSLGKVICLASVPPQLNNSFNIRNCILQVPKGCEDLYKKADGWKDFAIIETISKEDNVKIDVNTMDGKPLYTELEVEKLAELEEGLYIINVRK